MNEVDTISFQIEQLIHLLNLEMADIEEIDSIKKRELQRSIRLLEIMWDQEKGWDKDETQKS